MAKISSYHVGVSAEAFAAAVFARFGCDVLVQYGANQPEYDLVISKDNKSIKVSVKGSQDGSWGLTQSYLREADYHRAVDKWLSKHDERTLFCFVQFKNTDLLELPRLYLAWPKEIAKRLKETAKGRGDTILYETKYGHSALMLPEQPIKYLPNGAFLKKGYVRSFVRPNPHDRAKINPKHWEGSEISEICQCCPVGEQHQYC